MDSLKNKTYLITGANSGIGKALSNRLAEGGAHLFLIDKNTDQIELLMNRYYKTISYQSFDLSNIEAIPPLMEECRKKGLLFDGLVHCAGVSPLMTLSDFNFTNCLLTYKVNLFSFMMLSRFFAIDDFSKNGSSIVGISSSTSVYGGNRQYLYSSTKAGMNLFVKSTAKELAQRGTRINTVMPSITNTEMVAKLRKESDAIDMNVKYKQPLGIIEPDRVCNAIIFLLSDLSNAISGTCLKVNNGESY
jgi:NAD(P)-dependent dehydrogenase (short-subunit alcohol dehydrogenase family)